MRHFYILILAIGFIYGSSLLTSCSPNNTNVTKYDTTSKGGSFQIGFTTVTGSPESFTSSDYTVNGAAQVVLYANIMYNNADSLWYLNLQELDEKMGHVSVIFAGRNSAATGTFTSISNTSSVIDYTGDVNTTYAVNPGSTVNITSATYPIQGTFSFNLSYNYYTTVATGSFNIYK